MKRRALICGISGQDGAYLAQLLCEKDYAVWGTSRDSTMASFGNLIRLGVRDQVCCISMVPTDFRSVLGAITEAKPDEIYNLAGQSSVGLSFEQPVETMESVSLGTLNLLEAIRFTDRDIRLYNAGSSECFGDTGKIPATEETPFLPRSPYAVAKSAAHWAVANYREAYGVFACNGILFNHESPLRPPRFVTKKIIRATCEIAQGKREKLELGNLDIHRDWGSAEEYVEAMWRMLQHERPEDFVIATGHTSSLRDFVSTAFAAAELDWKDHVSINTSFFRPLEITYSAGSAAKAEQVLGWKAKMSMADVVEQMIAWERESMQSSRQV